MRRRSTWRAAPVTPGQLLPWLIILALALSIIACCAARIFWGNL